MASVLTAPLGTARLCCPPCVAVPVSSGAEEWSDVVVDDFKRNSRKDDVKVLKCSSIPFVV
jgi:hypothetical protein